MTGHFLLRIPGLPTPRPENDSFGAYRFGGSPPFTRLDAGNIDCVDECAVTHSVRSFYRLLSSTPMSIRDKTCSKGTRWARREAEMAKFAAAASGG